MLTDGSFEDRLLSWSLLRDRIKVSDAHLMDLTSAYNKVQRKSMRYDPWDQKNWPTPWEIIDNNHYCGFTITLAMWFTLFYTNRIGAKCNEIWITKNTNGGNTNYLLRIDDKILGYSNNLSCIKVSALPETEIVQKIFELNNKEHNGK